MSQLHALPIACVNSYNIQIDINLKLAQNMNLFILIFNSTFLFGNLP